MSNVIRMPSSKVTPVEVLERLLERAKSGEVKAVAFVSIESEDILRIGWSSMKRSELQWAVGGLHFDACQSNYSDED